MRVTNTGSMTRHWNQLKNLDTGTTLELGPGQSAETELPEGFSDLYLKPAGSAQPMVPPTPPVVAVPASPAVPAHRVPPTPADAANTEE